MQALTVDPSTRFARSGGALAALPLVALLAGVLAAWALLPPWLWMWSVAFALFAGCKVMTWAHAGVNAGAARSLAYLVLWPGMDARRFLDRSFRGEAPRRGEWAAAGVKMAIGAAMFWGVARLAPPPLAAGWIGMTGLVLMLHFGLFHLVSCVLRARGIDAPPIMRAPLLTPNCSEFWNVRWNRAFRDLAHEYVFEPARRFGTPFALMAVFVVSGLVHELLISVPARGGWGLPFAYFALQGLAVLFEKRLPRAARRPLAWLVIGGPAFLLFHPPFVKGVVLPMMRALGAL